MILGIIPARGGSKEIPNKNIKKLINRPLISYTIDAAKESKLLDRFVVSTEDPEIKKISQQEGVEVVDRPMELAQDDTPTLPVLQHVLSKIDADVVVLLQCTSPIRRDNLIDKCITKFMEKKADCLATGFMCKYKQWGTTQKRRQDTRGFFYDNGNVYVYKADLLKRGKTFGNNDYGIITSKVENTEIDDLSDWTMVELLLKGLVKR